MPRYSQVYSETSKMELSAKVINTWKPLTISVKNSIFDVWMGPEYAADIPITLLFDFWNLSSYLITRICFPYIF